MDTSRQLPFAILKKTVSCTSIIQNPGFETGNLLGWADGSWGGSTADVVGTSPHSGNYCLKCHSVGTSAGAVEQTIPTIVGTTYVVSTWYKGGGGWMWVVGFDQIRLSSVVDWTLGSFTFTADSTASTIVLQTPQGDNFTEYFDDVAISS